MFCIYSSLAMPKESVFDDGLLLLIRTHTNASNTTFGKVS